MRGILRTAGLCFSWVPLQSWLLGIGVALLVVAHLGHTLGDLPGLAVGMGLALGLTLVLVPATLATGVMLRGISAPQALRLVPYARLQVLLGVLLAMVVLAAFLSINVALLRLELPPAHVLSPLAAFTFTLAAQTAVTLLLFLLGKLEFSGWIVLMVLSWPQLLGRLPVVSGAIHRIGVLRIAALLLMAAWTAFSTWYLRARRISPPAWGGFQAWGPGLRKGHGERIAVSRQSVITVHLLGLASIASLVRRIWFGLGAYALLVIVPLALGHPRTRQMDPNLGGLLVFGMVFALGFPGAFMTSGVARRARTLWLPGGFSREQLFRLCERLIWRCAAAIGVPAAMLCVAAWIFLPHAATDWRYVAAAVLATFTITMYLGLMNVRGWVALDIAAAILIVVFGWGAAVMVPLFSGRPATPAMIAIVIVEAMGALGLRLTARRRWQRIDWLTFRPQRTATQALRPAA
ncbi:MAG: hypothetical protein ACREU2_09525 [Steroidobacteraceae bacterium]